MAILVVNTDGPGTPSLNSKLNWLRAGVLGANDGIVSTAGLVMGVAGASASRSALLIAGLAGLVAGALSMAGGEFVSVSSQKDTEIAELAQEQWELTNNPDGELEELADIYRSKGISDELAHRVATELTAHDALAAHAEAELGISSLERTSPWHAAIASMIAFTLGATIPLLLMVLSPHDYRVLSTLIGVLLALMLTGWVSAHMGGAGKGRPMVRNVIVGTLAMLLTYLVGRTVGGAL
ncbi:MAG TPA: VIT family protein [Propionibacteriaceae bacterium]|nr:VIT family protein [Propionibacteriaceae bacterium]